MEERGALFEGFIAGILRAYRSYRKLFDSWAYWSAGKHEVDFLLFRGDKCVAIEAKSGARYRSEDTEALEILAQSQKFNGIQLRRILVYTGNARLQTKSGIDILPWADLIQEIETNQLWT